MIDSFPATDTPRTVGVGGGAMWQGDGREVGADANDVGLVRLNTLVGIRWLAIAGQIATIAVVHAIFGMGEWRLPLAAVAASIIFNLVLVLSGMARRRVSGAVACWHLGFDLVQLSALLFLTGGVHNPFALFLLAPVTVGAATLSLRQTALLVLLAVALFSVLTVHHRPLPFPEVEMYLPPLYVAGTWTALVLSTAFAALYTWRMAEEARRRADALSAAQIALAHEQRFAAVGAMAAAVAHEMSTPLATITLVVKDMAAEVPPNSPLAEDVRLLVSQVERCRTILTQLGQQRDAETDAAIDRLPLESLVEMAAAPHRPKGDDKGLVFSAGPLSGHEAAPAPWLDQRPEILHGLGNLIQNALQFATKRVDVHTRWSDEAVSVTIADDGPGFSPHLLARVGEPYISSRAGEHGHMGLGIFIAATLLSRTGGTLTIDNGLQGGAVATVTWPRSAFGQGPGQ